MFHKSIFIYFFNSYLDHRTVLPKLENSYKTEPDDSETFNVCAVERAIANVLNRHLADQKYDKDTSPKLALKLCGLIKSDVKRLCLPRYKIVSQVIINERKGQALNVCSRSLWEEKFDNYGCATFMNDEIFAIGIVHGLYFD